MNPKHFRFAMAAFALALAPLGAGAALEKSQAAQPATSATPPAPSQAPEAAMPADKSDKAVGFASNSHVAAGQKVEGDAVSILSSTVVDGEVSRDAVAVMGDATVNGKVGRNAVTVHGTLTINGEVGRDAVAVGGDVVLGPKALVGGKVVCVGGSVKRDPGATIRKGIEQRSGGDRNFHLDDPSIAPFLNLGNGTRHSLGAPNPYFWHGLLDNYVFSRWGHPFALALRMGCALFFLVIYLLIAAIAPESVKRTGERFRHRAGLAVLSALLSLLALPFVSVLLCVTIIGIPVAVLLLTGLFCFILYGKACLYALIGRSIGGEGVHPVLAVLVTALVFGAITLLPVFGVFVAIVLLFLGLACAITSLMGEKTAAAATPAPVVPAPVPPVIATATPPVAAPAPVVQAPVAPVPVAPPEQAASAPAPATVSAQAPLPPPPAPAPDLAAIAALPRAGFWIRVAAIALDAIVVGMASFYAGPWFLLILAAYGAVMWKIKGSTVGGIVFGLQVVRLDAKPLEWDTAIVRALGCFLSMAVLFLGFFWIAIDSDNQGWHDKIAGTVVVRNRKLSLV